MQLRPKSNTEKKSDSKSETNLVKRLIMLNQKNHNLVNIIMSFSEDKYLGMLQMTCKEAYGKIPAYEFRNRYAARSWDDLTWLSNKYFRMEMTLWMDFVTVARDYPGTLYSNFKTGNLIEFSLTTTLQTGCAVATFTISTLSLVAAPVLAPVYPVAGVKSAASFFRGAVRDGKRYLADINSPDYPGLQIKKPSELKAAADARAKLKADAQKAKNDETPAKRRRVG